MRPVAHVAPFILMKPVGNNLYELVVLDGHKARTVSNSDDPPNSYHTGDLFQRHLVLPDAWKAVGRLDDRITLVTGEKILPLSIEGRIRQDALIKEAVVFGNDKPFLGLLLFRAGAYGDLSDMDYLDRVWPTIQDANSRVETSFQIARHALVILPSDVDCPSTDKGSIQRSRVCDAFAAQISSIYGMDGISVVNTSELSVLDLEAWIIRVLGTHLDISVPSGTTALSNLGLDSSKALYLRNIILKEIMTSSGDRLTLSASMIFECGTTQALAKALHELRRGRPLKKACVAEQMSALSRKYSAFPEFKSTDTPSGGLVVVGSFADKIASLLTSRSFSLAPQAFLGRMS